MGKGGVGHPDLVDGVETNLHSHAGGGGGPTIKAGTIITDGSGVGSVVFSTPFLDTNYAVSLSGEGSVDAIIPVWKNKTVDGFDVESLDDGGKSEANVIVDWIAVSLSNP